MSTKILAFNTVTELCSVAVMIDNKIYKYNVIAPQTHSEKILVMIDKLLIDVGITLKTLDCIVFDQGPGNFIGMRIGINLAQGLALGSDLPLVAVSSLNVLAQGAFRIFSNKHIIAVIDARMNELYWAYYSYTHKNNNYVWISHENVCLVNTKIAQDLIYKLQGQWILVGTGWNSNQELKLCVDSSNTIIAKTIMLPEAQDMLSLGVYALEHKLFIAPDQIKPLYLRPALIKRKRIFI